MSKLGLDLCYRLRPIAPPPPGLLILNPGIKNRVCVSSHTPDRAMNSCHHIFDSICVDYRGNLILCCNLASVAAGDGSPTHFGPELLANTRGVS